MGVVLWVLLLSVPLTAAGNLVAGKFALASFSPAQANALRYALALLVLLPLSRRWPRPTLRELPMLAACGLTGICIYNLLFFGAMQLISAAEAALLEMTIPAASLVLAWLVLGERVTVRQIVGIVVSWTGALWLLRILPFGAATAKTGADWRGEMLMLAGVGCFAVYSIVSTLAMKRLPPPAVATWSALFGTAPLLLLAAPEFLARPQLLTQASAASWAGVIYGGLVGFVFNIVAWYYCFRAVGVARTNVFLYLVPVFGALMAVPIFDEHLSAWQVFGSAVTLAGVVVATFERTPSRPSAGVPSSATALAG